MNVRHTPRPIQEQIAAERLAGLPGPGIARAHGIGKTAVYEIAERVPVTEDIRNRAEAIKKELEPELFETGRTLIRHALSQMHEMKPYAAGILGCAVIDKAQAFSAGGVGVAIQVNVTPAQLEDKAALHARIHGDQLSAPVSPAETAPAIAQDARPQAAPTTMTTPVEHKPTV